MHAVTSRLATSGWTSHAESLCCRAESSIMSATYAYGEADARRGFRELGGPFRTFVRCGFMDWLSDDPDNLKLAALVREEVERADAERGKIRRDYIDQRIDKKNTERWSERSKLSDLESKISELGTRLDVVSRRAGTPELALSVDRPAGPTSEDFEKLRGDIQATIGRYRIWIRGRRTARRGDERAFPNAWNTARGQWNGLSSPPILARGPSRLAISPTKRRCGAGRFYCGNMRRF